MFGGDVFNFPSIGAPINAKVAILQGVVLMIRLAIAAGLLTVMLGSSSFAATAQQKMATCKFGADNQKLTGSQRAKFIKDCMANRDDPRGSAPGTAPGHN
jgi:psiF repeat